MNYTLAFESSTDTPSASLLCDETVLESASWESTRGASQRMFSAVSELLNHHGIDLDAITLLAVGLGPGGFTGLRIALSAVRAFALPNKTPIMGLSSAEALAYRIQQDHAIDSGRILVLGDARRKRLWVGTFDSQPKAITQVDDFSLVPIADFAATLSTGDILVSPDWDRLGSELTDMLPDSAICIQSDARPTAQDVAMRAILRATCGTPSAPLEPIYMHPPVFVEPRFTESKKRRV